MHPENHRPNSWALLTVWLALAALGLAQRSALAGPGAASPPALSQPRPDFKPNVPLILLDAPGNISAYTPAPATVRLVLPGQSVEAATPLAAHIRVRGASSQRYEKKSFAFTLAQPARLLDLREDTQWVLQAAYVDRSLMRHKLGYDLFLALHTPEAPRYAAASRFVEVFLNGEYHGAYLLMERVDGPLLNMRPWQDGDAAHACLYKAVNHDANFSHSDASGYEQHEPDPAAQPYWQPLEGLNRFVSTTPDAEFFAVDKGIGSRLDLANAMDFHLLVLLTANSDGITKNFYVGRDGQAAGPVTNRWFFVPWDYDGTFGRNWDGRPYPANGWLSNNLFNRLMRDEAYRRQFAARWRELREGVFSVESLRRMMDDNVRTLGPAAQRNATRWPTIGGGDYPDELTFEQDLAEMKAWIERRVRWLDQEMDRRERSARR